MDMHHEAIPFFHLCSSSYANKLVQSWKHESMRTHKSVFQTFWESIWVEQSSSVRCDESVMVPSGPLASRVPRGLENSPKLDSCFPLVLTDTIIVSLFLVCSGANGSWLFPQAAFTILLGHLCKKMTMTQRYSQAKTLIITIIIMIIFHTVNI